MLQERNICCIFEYRKELTNDLNLEIMTLLELTNELPNLKENNNKIYSDLVLFSEYMLMKEHKINSVDFSSKSCSTYVTFELSTGDLYCVRFSDHRPSGNYGITDLSYFDNCTIEENYEEVEIFIEENC